jgi:hypothetical protein
MVGVNRSGVQQTLRKGHHLGHQRERNPNWRGGRRISRGYVLISRAEHPRADTHGYVPEHVLIAETALGRSLAAAHPVHHVDECRSNNVGGNLVICEDAAYHKLLHRRARAFAACGSAGARSCHICKSYDRQSDISVSTSDHRGFERAYHRSCAANRERARRAQEN